MEEKSFRDEADQYVDFLKKKIEKCSKHEAVHILLEDVRYLYWSAIDWRSSYKSNVAKSKGKKEEENDE
ncbi:hypothetical protein [ANMV-1 virus]|nr:hypothetical protein [ANMV-1 virus]